VNCNDGFGQLCIDKQKSNNIEEADIWPAIFPSNSSKIVFCSFLPWMMRAEQAAGLASSFAFTHDKTHQWPEFY